MNAIINSRKNIKSNENSYSQKKLKKKLFLNINLWQEKLSNIIINNVNKIIIKLDPKLEITKITRYFVL